MYAGEKTVTVEQRRAKKEKGVENSKIGEQEDCCMLEEEQEQKGYHLLGQEGYWVGG